MNIALVLRQRLNYLRADYQLLLDHHENGIIAMHACVVGVGSHCDQVVRETLDTLWANRMRSNHHVEIVSLQEGIQVIYAKAHNVILLLRISNLVVLETGNIFSLMRITPKEINHFLVMLNLI